MEPYRGLQPYTEEYEEYFFGRDAERAILVDKILSDKLTLLFSATGVGKSSLLQAAVIPELKRPARENLDVVYYNDWVTPPLTGLKQKILAALQERGKIAADFEFPSPEEPGVGQFPSREGSGVGHSPLEGGQGGVFSLKDFLHICATFASEPLVIILDQFEEFFQYQRYAETFTPFIEQLSEAIRDRETPVNFLISMREDFALNLNAFKEHLPTTLFENYYRLEKLKLDAAEEAIRKPVEKIGFKYEQDLLPMLLKDLAGQEREGQVGRRKKLTPENIPIFVEAPNVQIVCTQLWELEKNNADKLIRKQTYIEKNRADGFIDSYFGRIIGKFSALEKKLASKAFNHLVTPRGTKMAYPVKDLSDMLRVDERELESVLAKLGKARVLRSQSREGVIWYELYHDIFSGIINHWNSTYKAKQRIRNTIITTGIIVSILLVFIILIVIQPARYYLHLNTTSDQIEVYRGKAVRWNIFYPQKYEAETPYKRGQLEPDKQFIKSGERFTKIPVADYDDLNLELIGKLPIIKRISAYWETGEIEKALKLADKTISKDDMTTTQQVINLLADFRSQKSFAILEKHLDPSEDNSIRASIVSAISFTQFAGVTDALVTLLTDQSSNVRLRAVEALGRLGSDEAVEPLKEMLHDQDSDVRRCAEETLDQIGGDEVVESPEKLFENYSWNVRNYEVEILSQLDSDETLELLVEQLSDESPDMRREAARKLGRLGSNEAIGPLVKSLKDQDWDVRYNAAWALVQIGSNDVVGEVVELLKDQDLEVRYNAAWILGHLGSGEAVEPLLESLKSRNTYVQGRAAEALGKLDSVEAVGMLVERLKEQESMGWSNIVWVLGELGGSEAVVPLVKLLKDQDWDVQCNAVWALGKIGGNEVVRPLLELLSNKNSYVRGRAAEALGRVGSVEVVPFLLERLKDENEYVQRNAALALGKLSAREAIDALNILYSQETQAKLAVTAVLLSFNQEDGLEFLREESESENISKRKEVAVVLGEVPSEQGNVLLLNMLNDKNIDAKIQVIASLGCAHAVSALPDLHKILSENPKPEIQEIVVKALGKIASAESIDILKAIALDDQARVPIRLSAINGLSNIKAEKAVTALLEILEKTDEHYHYKMIIALGKTQSTNALDPLLKRLQIEEQRRREWRKIRDEDIDSYTDEQKEEWRTRLEAVKPRQYLEFELVYAIAQIDPDEEGIKLLSHDLYAAKKGAWMGLVKVGSVPLIQHLDHERMQSQYPLFRRAAYQAIDKTLINIQAYGGKRELAALEKFLPDVMDQEGVKTRIEWTIARLKERNSPPPHSPSR